MTHQTIILGTKDKSLFIEWFIREEISLEKVQKASFGQAE